MTVKKQVYLRKFAGVVHAEVVDQGTGERRPATVEEIVELNKVLKPGLRDSIREEIE
jgi:hypothetical protein